MDKPHNQERIVTIHQMLFEMARGNFNSRIPLTSYGDELETIAVLINMVAEEMKESVFYSGFINTRSRNSPQFSTQNAILLDDHYLIKSYTPEILPILGYLESEFMDMTLATILSTSSMERVHKLVDVGVSLQTIIQLEFINKEHSIIATSCSVRRLNNRIEIMLQLIPAVNHDSYYPILKKSETNKPLKTTKVDAFLIQKLYDYIIANLEEPLPSLQILARKFSTNEHKLKAGFRHFFKTSIYQFYNDERLKRAYFMIEHTGIPLKNISVMNGFNNYPNFSKSFKKRFGFSPYELKRNEVDFTLREEDQI